MKIAVIIPAYKVKAHILKLLEDIGPEVAAIYVVDDCCPEQSGKWVQDHVRDPRVKAVFNPENLGVGGAVLAGYEVAVNDGYEILVKIDGDGQMDPRLIHNFTHPIAMGRADYTKGNRFYNLEDVVQMPKVRVFGNAVLSFMAKLSTGYWGLFDPTNGYTAIHANVARLLPSDKISKRYFFETDVLFRLNTLGAAVEDIPMTAVYGDEVSGLSVKKILPEFLYKHGRNACKRIFYNYYLRGASIASIELPLGISLLIFGTAYGAWKWISGIANAEVNGAGTVMLSGLPVILGTQLLLGFLAYDMRNLIQGPIWPKLKKIR